MLHPTAKDLADRSDAALIDMIGEQAVGREASVAQAELVRRNTDAIVAFSASSVNWSRRLIWFTLPLLVAPVAQILVVILD